jgi:hypothetical protein
MTLQTLYCSSFKLCTALVSNFVQLHYKLCSPSFKTLHTELVKNFGLWYYKLYTSRLKNFGLTHYIIKVCSASYKTLHSEFIKLWTI